MTIFIFILDFDNNSINSDFICITSFIDFVYTIKLKVCFSLNKYLLLCKGLILSAQISFTV